MSDDILKFDDFVEVAKDCRDMSFRQVWEVYDKQFKALKQAVQNMGDKFVVEEFKGDDGPELTLSHTFQKGHTIVYVNDVIQWKDTDYEETSNRTISLKMDLVPEDTIKVVVVLSSMLVNESDLVYTKVEDIVNKRIYEIVYDILKKHGIITDDPDNPDGD